MPTARYQRSRAVRLIEALIAAGIASDGLAATLVVSPSTLDTFRRGRVRMPLDRQLLLARLVLERWPQTDHLRRAAYALRSQVIAELHFHAGTTKMHVDPRVEPWSSRL